MNEIRKVYKCQFCKNTYQLSWDDCDRTHQWIKELEKYKFKIK